MTQHFTESNKQRLPHKYLSKPVHLFDSMAFNSHIQFPRHFNGAKFQTMTFRESLANNFSSENFLTIFLKCPGQAQCSSTIGECNIGS